jgi:hypothetical protein
VRDLRIRRARDLPGTLPVDRGLGLSDDAGLGRAGSRIAEAICRIISGFRVQRVQRFR